MVSAEIITQTVINSIFFGSLYAIIGIGMAIIWGLMEIINFTHGVVIVLGGTLAYLIVAQYGLPPFATIIVVAIFLAFIGGVLQRFFLNPVMGAHMSTFIVTLGLAYLIEGGSAFFLGREYRDIPFSLFGEGFPITIPVLGIFLPGKMIEVLLTAFVLIAAMQYFLDRTFLGRAMNAVMQDKEAAMLVGIDVRKIYVMAFVLASGLNAFVGYNYMRLVTVTIGDWVPLLVYGFAISIMYLITNSLWFMFLGAILLSLTENIVTLFLPVGYKELVTVMVVVFILLWKFKVEVH